MKTLRLSSLIKGLPILFLVITILVFVNIVKYSNQAQEIELLQSSYKQLGIDIKQVSDNLTNWSKAYATTGDKEYYNLYMDEVNINKNKERALSRLIELDAEQSAIKLLEKAKELSDSLTIDEISMFKMVELGKKQDAIDYIYGDEYKIKKEKIDNVVYNFQIYTNADCHNKVLMANNKTMVSIYFAFFIILLIIVCIFVISTMFNRKIKSIIMISNMAKKISHGDFNVNLTEYQATDEFGVLAKSFGTMIGIIDNIKKEMNKIMDATLAGNYDKMADTESFEGEWRVILLKLNDMLQAVVREKIKAVDVKNRFLVNMSHEIRTPMNAIIGLSQLALMRNIDKRDYETFQKILDSSKNLLIIINDILDYSKIEADKLELYEEEFNLETVIANTLLMASEKIGSKIIELILEIEPNVPYYLIGDKTRLWQILKNLLDNAAKYTEKGHIILKIQNKGTNIDSDGNVITSIKFIINDTGMGMTKEQLNNLFVPFEQFHNKGTSQIMGTGLGMVITKQLIELMGGNITVSSEVQVGTTVELLIHFRMDKMVFMSDSVCENDIEAQHIMIVDADKYSLNVMKNILKLFHIVPVCVTNGFDALSTVSKLEDNQFFDIVIINYRLDDMSAIELAEELNKYNKVKSKLLMSSTYEKQMLEEDLTRVGFNDYIEKPFVPTTFVQKLSINNQEQVQQAVVKYNIFPTANVLVCEDNYYNQDVIKGLLDIFGIKPIIAENGSVAIDLLSEKEIHLILMDIFMPVMDGYEATILIRKSNTNSKNIPIIAMTANVMNTEIQMCLNVGMNDHLHKPIDINILYELLKTYLSEHMVVKDDMFIDIEQNVYSIAAESKDELVISGIDLRDAMYRYGGNKDAYMKTLIKFVKDMQDNHVTYEDFIGGDNLKQSEIYIHTLKGVLGNLSITELYNETVLLEEKLLERNLSYANYSRWCSLYQKTKELLFHNIPQFYELNDQSNESFEQLIIILKTLREALNDSLSSECSDLMKCLSNVSIQESYKNFICNLSEYIESFDYDKALCIIEEYLSEIN